MSLMALLISSILVENIILTKFLGLCSFLGVSNQEQGALGMGICVTLVMLLANILCFFLYHYLLVPYDIEYLRTITFILIIASLVQLTEMIIRKYFPKIQALLGIYLPLIATNCAILGAVLLTAANNYTFTQTLVFTLGSGLGYSLVLYIFSSIREKLNINPILKGFQGTPIALITAGIMSMIFGRFIGG
ncbi:MAG: Rnf-Nqr domain containing protein [Bacilli bacterium]|jgi:electron transport complex protein RnfA